MTGTEPADGSRRDLRGAWWVAAAAVLFFAAVAVVQIREVRQSRQRVLVGDGRHPETYGFDLDTLTLPGRWLAAAMPRDALPHLDLPPLLDADGVEALNRAERGKYLVGDDLVLGVALGGAARAYPLRVMHWHEVANDTVGGVPLAVAWHPLSGSAVVLDRRHHGRELMLRASGLVWNSHHLLFADAGRDPDPAARLSLWAPLLAEAVAGPAAGDTLAVIPAALVRWRDWRAAFPTTTVPWPQPGLRPAYKRDPYGNYQSGDVLRFPVVALPPPAAGPRLKDLQPHEVLQRRGLPFARRHAYRFAWQALDAAPGAAGAGR